LILLTESGLLYAVIQIIRLALVVSVVPSTPQNGSLVTAFQVFERTTMIIAAMYPPALILIINHNYSMADSVISTSTDTSISRSTSDPPFHDHLPPVYARKRTSDIVFRRRCLCAHCEMNELRSEEGASGSDVIEGWEVRGEETGWQREFFGRGV
jgi:hypothetical protein